MRNDGATRTSLTAFSALDALHTLHTVRRLEYRAVLSDARVEIGFDPERGEYVLGRTRAS